MELKFDLLPLATQINRAYQYRNAQQSISKAEGSSHVWIDEHSREALVSVSDLLMLKICHQLI
ncbi:MAG: hypothetical protein BGN99_28175 [Alphaproteobacteria bacterium 65-37]|nr:MAG: hypothetical protein BGN99_28175 [Alphaproteobacteria bacterium 65-37]